VPGFRDLVSPVVGLLNWEKSKCRRTLHRASTLLKMVQLDEALTNWLCSASWIRGTLSGGVPMNAKLLTRIRALEKSKTPPNNVAIVIRFVDSDLSVSRKCILKDGKLADFWP
jgi:hypothetical protein